MFYGFINIILYTTRGYRRSALCALFLTQLVLISIALLFSCFVPARFAQIKVEVQLGYITAFIAI